MGRGGEEGGQTHILQGYNFLRAHGARGNVAQRCKTDQEHEYSIGRPDCSNASPIAY